MRISDWSSDVCSSDLLRRNRLFQRAPDATGAYEGGKADLSGLDDPRLEELVTPEIAAHVRDEAELAMAGYAAFDAAAYRHGDLRSEERRGGKACVSPFRSRWMAYH